MGPCRLLSGCNLRILSHLRCLFFGNLNLKKAVTKTSSSHSVKLNTVALSFLAAFIALVLILILTSLSYIDLQAFKTVFTTSEIRYAIWTSIWTSCVATAISLVFAIPAGYALSRCKVPARILADTIVDLPIVFPPFVVGLILQIFFRQTAPGRFIHETMGLEFIFRPTGIVLCQFLVAASYAVRFSKIAFDNVDNRCRQVALTLGCTRWSSFRHVSLPQAKSGIISGGLITWARSFGLFGPLMLFAGSIASSTQTLSTRIYTEQSSGNFQVALAGSLLIVLIALVVMLAVRIFTSKKVVSL